ncbi:family 78 glycoside hydrolase catalytic domain [Actinoplanes sp. NPDC051633]|uniref:family 78 glycoside hydrolase catalytic domain n=1 Tax=Actinoplanes sp. NPDC051633 TaxID=3155670 RepID=UPI0034242A07
MSASPHCLRVEHLDEPLGIHVAAPRLSWRLPEGAAAQTAYRLTGDNGWDTGRVPSPESVLVPYHGPTAASGERVEWRVKVWTDLGESDWSAPGWFEMGLLYLDDWQAVWIEADSLLRHEFDVDRPVVRARLYATARGLYEAFLNGQRVGDAELTPGFTQYEARFQVRAYDVTSLIRTGRNTIGAILADGWYRGQIGILRAAEQWGSRIALLAQLHLTHADSTTTVIGTGPGWQGARGHVVAADPIAGESWDLRRRSGRPSWAPVTRAEDTAAALTDSPAPPVRRVQELTPVSVTRLDATRQVVDLGQNINGWVRLSRLGPAGTELSLVHGEHLDATGDVTTEHLRPAVPFLPEPLPAGQVDHVVSAGEPGAVFEPRRTTHGFRYVRVEGHPQDLTPRDVTGVVVHTDMRRTGWFSCSDDRINRLHEAAVWSLRGNVCDIPTDCPHRERAGWTGDWQLYVPTAAFLYDVAGFTTKWLRDVASDQWPDGTIANISPAGRSEGRDSPIAFLNGSAGWGDAAVIVPWEIYRAYADERILAEQWPSMVAWLGFVERRGDKGFHFGEWLMPGEDVSDLDAYAKLDKSDVAMAYHFRSASLMSRIAAVLGLDFDPSTATRVRAAWQARFIDEHGRLTPDTQANHVRALAFGLVPDELRPAAAERLVELIRERDTHLGTGFLATPLLLPVLADTGHLDVAYELLFQDTEPSWLTMIDRGATTLWERWDGVDADGVPHDSLNHYSKGAVVSFLHRYVAGIELLSPGYRRFRMRPRPGGGLTSAAAAHDCPYGRIEVSWRISDAFHLHVTVPPGTTADIVLPDGRHLEAGPGRHTHRSEGVTS